MNRRIQAIPIYLMLITSNALPVYGAVIGRLVFFQVIYLYWFESLLLIAFDCIRVAAAQGSDIGTSMLGAITAGGKRGAAAVHGFDAKLKLILQMIVVRVGILLFYLLFIVAFIAHQVTDKAHQEDVGQTMGLRNPFFNTAVIIFLISMAVQLIGGFFISGKYRTDSPLRHISLFSGRTFLLHIMIVSSAILHQFFFAGKPYETTGEIVYIGLFMLIKTVADVMHVRSRFNSPEDGVPMI